MRGARPSRCSELAKKRCRVVRVPCGAQPLEGEQSGASLLCREAWPAGRESAGELEPCFALLEGHVETGETLDGCFQTSYVGGLVPEAGDSRKHDVCRSGQVLASEPGGEFVRRADGVLHSYEVRPRELDPGAKKM